MPLALGGWRTEKRERKKLLCVLCVLCGENSENYGAPSSEKRCTALKQTVHCFLKNGAPLFPPPSGVLPEAQASVSEPAAHVYPEVHRTAFLHESVAH